MVVIFNLHIVVDLRQRQQVGGTCLALGAQRGKVGSAPQLQRTGSSRAVLSPSARPKLCSSFQSLLTSSPKSQALRMSRVGRKGISAPEQAQDFVLGGCSVGQGLIYPWL